MNERNYQAKLILKNHEITPLLRTKMIDWMEIVFSMIRMSESTLEVAVTIMDYYLLESVRKYNKTGLKKDIYLIGITSIWIASKSNDLTPISVVLVEGEMGHYKFSLKEIMKQELEIL